MITNRRSAILLAATCLTLAGMGTAAAQDLDKVRVGVFPSSSALPYYIALDRGYFAGQGIEVETVILSTHPLIIQSLVTGDIDVASNVVTLEGANIVARRPDTLKYIAINGQNAEYITEQFVVPADSEAETLADLEGARLFSAPGPANMGAAIAVLSEIGLEEGADYTMQEQPMGNHIGAIQSGSFEGGYTLEPLATNMIAQGIAKRLEAGVISTYLLGDAQAEAYAAGAAFSSSFIGDKADVAARFAAAWALAVEDANNDPSARELLAGDMNVPPDLVRTVPLAHFVMASDLTEDDIADFQKFVDVGVDLGVVPTTVDASTLLTSY
ncbi:NMT1/THI5 like protein [Devosia equisanguinis]|uniref:NMT1/THI5 like protein n=1 Tax=Devosia equisanguinis TaxID=2490941 RepID=A0A3S4GEV1_9HYPH|nr:ABC transporter substrate-binding protein [Devosia equisanguinis]VDS02907.1 NMT1/THI5 like protein [Devosia equisanguinis]